MGKHDDAIRCVEFCSDVNVLVTGSWDQTVKLWDARISHCAGSFSQPDKVKKLSLLQASVKSRTSALEYSGTESKICELYVKQSGLVPSLLLRP